MAFIPKPDTGTLFSKTPEQGKRLPILEGKASISRELLLKLIADMKATGLAEFEVTVWPASTDRETGQIRLTAQGNKMYGVSIKPPYVAGQQASQPRQAAPANQFAGLEDFQAPQQQYAQSPQQQRPMSLELDDDVPF